MNTSILFDEDERGDVPSASNTERYVACTASHNFAKDIPYIPSKEVQEWSASGDRIHSYIAATDFAQLTDATELDIALRCIEQRDMAIKKVFSENAPFCKVVKEERLWLKQGRKRVFSGKPDDIRIYGDTALITDYKTGRGGVSDSPKNRQLRSLAVLLHQSEYGKLVRRIYVAVIQPLLEHEPLMTCYEEEHLTMAEAELRKLIEVVTSTPGEFNAGEQCKYCPAKFKCDKAREMLAVVGATKTPIQAEGEELARLLGLCYACEPIINQAKDRAKQLLSEAPDSIPGYYLGKPGANRVITEPMAVFKVLVDAGKLTREQFIECVKVGVGDLESAVHAADTNLTAKQAKDVIKDLCEPFIAQIPKEASLKKL